MKTISRGSLILLAALLLIACGRSEFTRPVDLAMIETAVETAGLQRCVEEDLLWDITPGFVVAASSTNLASTALRTIPTVRAPAPGPRNLTAPRHVMRRRSA
ncbi:MAG: hypothetical protein IPK16_33400 [Anaerolineales bacterium]|nr:hypothetical protein [Anaerolineales bacterium]